MFDEHNDDDDGGGKWFGVRKENDVEVISPSSLEEFFSICKG